MENTVISLCPACSACPQVVIEGDTIRIGEDQNLVTLKKASGTCWWTRSSRASSDVCEIAGRRESTLRRSKAAGSEQGAPITPGAAYAPGRTHS